MALRGTVRNGRLVVDAPTELPEGTVVDLVLDDEGDDLDDEQRAALHAAIDRSLQQAQAGQSAPASVILDKLRARREG
ncbi:MAG TPA: hypothetical protein DEF51_12690 [Myxococcales bacterium]|nr:hypothetical protein [Myxococcales bacterium]